MSQRAETAVLVCAQICSLEGPGDPSRWCSDTQLLQGLQVHHHYRAHYGNVLLNLLGKRKLKLIFNLYFSPEDSIMRSQTKVISGRKQKCFTHLQQIVFLNLRIFPHILLVWREDGGKQLNRKFHFEQL